MRQSQYPIYQETDSIYIAAFGIERTGQEAFWGPGRRDHCIVHYVLSGEGIFNGCVVQENQGFIFDAGQLVEYYPDKRNPWNYFWIDCSVEFAERYLKPSLEPDINGLFQYGYKGKLLSIIERIFSYDRPMNSVESLAFAFSILMLHTPVNTETKAEHYVRQAKRYIDSSLNRKLTVYDVADALSIHDRYLYSLFVKHEGISPKEYILKKKIETATDLLETTSLSILEIALALGFPDVYSFSKLFKVKMGMAPSAYRNSIKHER